MSNKTLSSLLVEAELYQYYDSFRNTLKVNSIQQLKYVQDDDLLGIAMSRPEIRRLRKYYQKYQKMSYFKKLKKFATLPVYRNHKNYSEAYSVVPSSDQCPVTSYDGGSKHIISANQISVQKKLGSGEFGTVQQGIWTNGNERIQVAVKCLNKANVQTNPMEFIKEAAIMHAIEHENIVRLYGVVLDTDSSIWLVTELAPMRSLLECLKDSELRTSLLNVSTLCEYIYQICNGMREMAERRLIHRDLAARNILVFSKNKIKISDFGLSRALNVGKTYYQTNFNINLKLPIAWSSPESINFLRFTTASDVWSFGVCVWEIFSYGFQPWAGMTGQQILEAIDVPQLLRLEQPECCPKDYYTWMLRCWEHEPADRPTFSDILHNLPLITPLRVVALKDKSDPSNEMLNYRSNEQITVLDRITFSPFWKGITNSGKTGLFDPAFCFVLEENNCEHITKKKHKLPYMFGACSAATLDSSKMKRDNGIPSEDQEQLIPLTPTHPQNKSFDQEIFAPKCPHYYEIYPALANTWNSLKKGTFSSQSQCNPDGCGLVKQISLKDEKILEQAIEIANKITSKSISNSLKMNTDKKWTGLKFPPKMNNHSFDVDHPHSSRFNCGADQNFDLKTFTEKLKCSADLQSILTEENQEAYNNLVEKHGSKNSQHQPSSLQFTPNTSCNTYDLNDIFKNNLRFNQDETLQNQYKTEQKSCDCPQVPDEIEMNNKSNNNAIPLPPRPKKLPTLNKRHVRKYPLKIPDQGTVELDAHEGLSDLASTEINMNNSNDLSFTELHNISFEKNDLTKSSNQSNFEVDSDEFGKS